MRHLAAWILLLHCGNAAAQSGDWRLGVAMGYGERGNPLIQSDDLPVVVDLDVAWFGERFFFDNGDLGFTFADGAAATASLMARVRSDRVFFGRADLEFVNVSLAGEPIPGDAVPLEVPNRDYAVEAGTELLTDGRWGYLQVSAFQDISGVHDGYEIGIDYGVGFALDRWYIEPGVRVVYKSEALNDYYWGIRESEANSALPAYTAGAGVNVGARLQVAYYLSKQWAWRVAVDYERLDGEIADSPVVARDHVVGYFAGISYGF